MPSNTGGIYSINNISQEHLEIYSPVSVLEFLMSLGLKFRYPSCLCVSTVM